MWRDRPDMQAMKHAVIILALLSVAAAAPTSAQIVPQIAPAPPVPQPPPPPPPKMDIPQVPKMDAPPPSPQPSTKSQGRGSFNDRVIDCLTDGDAARLNATDRAAYSRACANRS